MEHSQLYNANFMEAMYERFLSDPQQLSADWQHYFQNHFQANAGDIDADKTYAKQHIAAKARFSRRTYHPILFDNLPVQTPVLNASIPSENQIPCLDISTVEKQNAVLRLINYYRTRGHEAARCDPLKLHDTPQLEDLDPCHHNLNDTDLQRVFYTGSFFAFKRGTLADILHALRSVYCGSIGAEYMHISENSKRRWIQARLETDWYNGNLGLDTDARIQILERLTAAEGLEHFLHKKYVGQKRFSLEGAESLIPLLDTLIQSAGKNNVKEMVFGMAHRGRLNVLVNIMGKTAHELFDEFEGKVKIKASSGDVKYHQGYSSDVMTSTGPMHLTLAFNPSHLEIINPVVEGSVRARQARRKDKLRQEVLPVLIHGDAAFSGQGVVMETLNLSQTHGYKTGGTLHIIINNQIGFTSSDPFDSRSSAYCTDVAKMVSAPIFHVNGDDPEAVVFVTKVALDFRNQFNMDVVIDMVCYRRHGHNENDEPMGTQPMMYQKIKQRTTTAALYAEKLVAEGVIEATEAEAMSQQYIASLKARDRVVPHQFEKFEYGVNWRPYLGKAWTQRTPTHLALKDIQRLGERLTTWPDDFYLHRTVEKIMTNRRLMAAGKIPVDWGFAENLAYASLVEAGYPVRLSGQDSGRGTFAHRHALLHNQAQNNTYIPLQHISPRQADFLVINSLLSEEAVLGFELGYSFSEPDSLVIWEAQFGDFANGAQVVIDQFISCSEAKWQRLCGLVMFLPHGYDGQGPEHSSARIERYLQLCAENNMQVCIPSTPAQFFHLIRRQMLRPYRKPLIIFTPKSLLRDKKSASPLSELTEEGCYKILIDETDSTIDCGKVKRVLLCAGQIYYKLIEKRQQLGIDNVAILRLEQFYPFPRATLLRAMEKYSHTQQWFWVQDEPRNQGAWRFLRARILDTMTTPDGFSLHYAGRMQSASPAAGYLSVHKKQEAELLSQAFDMEYLG